MTDRITNSTWKKCSHPVYLNTSHCNLCCNGESPALIAEHTRWVLKDAVEKHELGLSISEDDIWYNERAEKAESDLERLKKRERDACNVMVLLRCEADLKEGCSKDVAMRMGQWFRDEKITGDPALNSPANAPQEEK